MLGLKIAERLGRPYKRQDFQSISIVMGAQPNTLINAGDYEQICQLPYFHF